MKSADLPPGTRLGRELRKLRLLSGLSGEQMGRAIGVSQRTVSRFETGDSVPSVPQVTAWAKAAGAKDQIGALVLLTTAAVSEVTVFRESLLAGLPSVQAQVRNLEDTARTIRNFQPGLIPGLLQTAAYGRRVLELGDVAGTGDWERAAAVRLDRQQALHQRGRLFDFVLTEAALRWDPGPPGLLAGQLHHIAALTGLPSVAISVIPADAEMRAITRCGFILYEERDSGLPPVAVIETPHAALQAVDPQDVDIYRAELEKFRQSAVSGDAAAAIIRDLAASRSLR